MLFQQLQMMREKSGYAARASLKLNYLSDAKKYIEKAKEYSDYFYENKLANMLNAVEYKLKMLEDAVPEH